MASFGHTNVHGVNEPDARAHTHTHTVGQRVQESTKTAHLHCSLMVKMFRCGEFKKKKGGGAYGYVNEVKNSIFIPGGL